MGSAAALDKIPSKLVLVELRRQNQTATRHIHMLAKEGKLEEAQKVFDGIEARNTETWNSMMRGYLTCGHSQTALEMFTCMNVPRNAESFLVAVRACGAEASKVPPGTDEKLEWLQNGIVLQSLVEKFGFQEYRNLQKALVDMFSACGSPEHAKKSLDNSLSPSPDAWSSLLFGYVNNGQPKMAVELFEHAVVETEACIPTDQSFLAVFAALAALADEASASDNKRMKRKWLEKGKAFHSQLKLQNPGRHYFQNVLACMYSNCGSMRHCEAVLEGAFERGTRLTSWNFIIRGHVGSGNSRRALELVPQADLDGTEFDARLLASLMVACGKLKAVEAGEAFHEEIRAAGLEGDDLVASCLVEFYGRVGRMDAAEQVFESAPHKSVRIWNCLIDGYSLQGESRHCLELLQQMKKDQINPDEISFFHVLTACKCAGLVDEGKWLFKAMEVEFGLTPELRHYGCMIDLLASANHLDEAVELAESCEADAAMWTSIWKACGKHNNAVLEAAVHKHLLELKGDASRKNY